MEVTVKKIFCVSLLIALITSAAPAIAGTGGPDSYGYIWRDTASGGPAYAWIDIAA